MEFITSVILFMSEFLSFSVPLCAVIFCISLATLMILQRARLRPNSSALSSSVCVSEQSGEEAPALGDGCEDDGDMAAVQTGTSILEQLMPEITMHALSFLDYPSLCRLSMTNSVMRKAANDESAWKALYQKDFTVGHGHMKPANGWKAYYEATRAIVNINNDFFKVVKEKWVSAMSQFWLDADYVKCIHPTGETLTGYNEVIESWRVEFSWEISVDFQLQDVKPRVLTDMAWVTMRALTGEENGPYNVTNVYERHNGRWYMVAHHSSAALIHGGADEQFLQA